MNIMYRTGEQQSVRFFGLLRSGDGGSVSSRSDAVIRRFLVWMRHEARETHGERANRHPGRLIAQFVDQMQACFDSIPEVGGVKTQRSTAEEKE